MLTIGKSSIVGINKLDQLGEVQGELTIGFHRANVVGTGIVLSLHARVVAIPFHDNHIILLHKLGDVVSAVLLPTVISSGSFPSWDVVPFAVAMKKINHGIALFRLLIIIRRQEDTKVTLLPQNFTRMLKVEDLSVGFQNWLRKNQQEAEATENFN